jgi:hypothetical protein
MLEYSYSQVLKNIGITENIFKISQFLKINIGTGQNGVNYFKGEEKLRAKYKFLTRDLKILFERGIFVK